MKRADDRKKNRTSTVDAIADLPMHRLAGMIRSGEVTSRRLVEIYLDRIRRYDGRDGINSYITVLADQALAEADKADRLVKAGTFRGLLHGLPIAVKDNIETRNVRTTAGSKILSSWVPSADAHVVRKLKGAGAIILGKTNMHEFALGATNNNPHYGPARNPYDLSRIPGGSSGGSGAATAAALCAASLGTDTGGSVRIPASLCGIVGLKPTLGRVGRSGVIPLSFSRDCIGPMTRTVIDAAMILQAIAGKDSTDPESLSRPIPRYAEFPVAGLKGRKFGLPARFIAEVIHPDTGRIMEESVRTIREMGGIVKEIDVRYIELSRGADANVVRPEAAYLIEEYLRRFDPQGTIGDYLDRLGPDVREILASEAGTPGVQPLSAHIYVKTMRDDCRKMKAGFDEALSGVDALILPTTPFPASVIGEDPWAETGGKGSVFLTYIRNCVPVSIAGNPAISVPAGYSLTGLPIGLQMVARPWEEAKLLAMAHAFEQETRVRKPPVL